MMDPYVLVAVCDWNEKWRLSQIKGLNILQYTPRLREVLGVESDEALVARLCGSASVTESLEEMHTVDLPSVLINYLAAMGMMNVKGSVSRELLLDEARHRLRDYVETTATRYGDDRIVEQWSAELSEANEKSRDKVLKRRKAMDSLERTIECPPALAKQAQQLCALSEQCTNYEDLVSKMEENALEDDDEEMTRELWLNIIELSLHSAVSEIPLLDAEISIIREMNRNVNPIDSNPVVSNPVVSNPVGKQPARKPCIIKISDKSELHRLYTQQVFQAPFAPPTMTIAECVQKEIEQDVHTLGAAQKRSMEKDSDDEDEDAKERKAREWDDWKDANPKGSGNKMVNRG
ncbi:TAP42-like family protein [Gregarina niphandrodes]|uniref:TAP42-like family protein n=1 Tax=Gregarina niphandrodes TaxID=110365 RepID=A0A023B6J7_GRENI|nr:TAP42-like family protein [Gregarina niphandrodes]EZG66585.1 TAP42-like family protein [Gregarina niphandrodes]|eukprot:XP_011130594.1 TAP42-like family protein [Gregarina niphandrodes]